MKLDIPSDCGVPLITPVPAARFNPVGSDPEMTDQLKGEVPPELRTV